MDWKVRFIDYPGQYQKIREDILGLIDATLSTGDVMLRQQLRDFEAHLATFCGTDHAVGTGNCTDALQLCLLAAGVGPGDEVITVSHTMVATAAAIHHTGATPVLADIGDDHNMDPATVEPLINEKTKAIMPVHLNGRVCDMDQISAAADTHGLIIIEDAAQALGASLNGKMAGSFGAAGCFSFYPAKLLGAYGDAGAAVMSDPTIADTVQLLRDHGRTPDGDIAFWSFNSRMDNLHAVMLDYKLARLGESIERRREIAALYHAALGSTPELLLPPPPDDEGPYYDVFQNFEIEAERSIELRTALTDAGVETLVPWGGKGVHQFPNLGLTHFELPRTTLMFERAILLPMHPELSDDDVSYVCDVVASFYR